ncbi:hypothetical protein ACFOW1_01565 [Parasediminibacterium paludis]|uniref:Uncharacterized protein n=1 Tax=Parasediminibacterium paludis TaxID=908966 RepID=A0ABV8PR10_9BACT
MKTTSFSSNPNGKLIANNFSTMRAFNVEKYFAGAEHVINYKGQVLGTAKVYGALEVDINNIPEVFAWLDAGMDLNRYTKVLKTMYPNATKLHYVAYHWVAKDIEAHANLINAYWQSVLQDAVEATNYQFLAQ